MKIGEVLSRAWNIIWKHKVLWLFGILASCGQSGTSSSSSASSGSAGSQSLMMPMQRMADVGEMGFVVVLLIIAAGAIFILLMVFLMLALNAVGRVGLVRGVVQAEAGQEKLSFGELLSGVKPFFWRVVGLNVLVGVSLIALALVSGVIFIIFTVVTLGIGLLALVPLLLLGAPLMWGVTVVVEQANVALVVEDLSILDALKRAWLVVSSNFGDYLVMGLILILGVGLLGALIIGLPILLVAAPFVIGLIFSQGEAMQAGTIMSLVCFSLYMPILLVLAGILRSYIITSWTLTYLRLAKPTPKSPVVIAEPKPGPAPTAEANLPSEPDSAPTTEGESPSEPGPEPAPDSESPPEQLPDPLTGE